MKNRQKNRKDQKGTSGGKLIASVVGATAAGLAAGILVAPEKGKKTRDNLNKQVQDWGQKAKKQGDQIKSQVKKKMK